MKYSSLWLQYDDRTCIYLSSCLLQLAYIITKLMVHFLQFIIFLLGSCIHFLDFMEDSKYLFVMLNNTM